MIKGKFIGLRAVEKEDLKYLRDWRNLTEFRKNFREFRELSMSDQELWFESLQNSRQTNFMFTIVDSLIYLIYKSMYVTICFEL